jgi:thioredoxin-related protein
MKRVLSGCLGLLLASLVQAADATRDPASYFFQENFGDLPEELVQAKAEHKQGILVFFEQDDCPFCARMKATILNQPAVQDYFRAHFRILGVDINGDLEMTDFSGQHVTQKEFAFRQFNVRATPVIAFFDLDGQLVTRFTGPTSDAQEFLWLGEYVVGGHYHDEKFTVYKRARRAQATGG